MSRDLQRQKRRSKIANDRTWEPRCCAPCGHDLWPRPGSQCGPNRATRWIHSGPENEIRARTRLSSMRLVSSLPEALRLSETSLASFRDPSPGSGHGFSDVRFAHRSSSFARPGMTVEQITSYSPPPPPAAPASVRSSPVAPTSSAARATSRSSRPTTGSR